MYCSERLPFFEYHTGQKSRIEKIEKIRREEKIEKYKKLREELIEK